MSPTDIPDILVQAQRCGDFTPVLRLVPYASFLGLRVGRDEEGFVVCMPGTDRLVGNPTIPALHGGSIGAMMELAAVFGLFVESQLEAVPKTISVTVDYLRPGRVVDTYARASITKHGRRVASVQVRAWQVDEAKPIAGAQAHFLLKNA